MNNQASGVKMIFFMTSSLGLIFQQLRLLLKQALCQYSRGKYLDF